MLSAFQLRRTAERALASISLRDALNEGFNFQVDQEDEAEDNSEECGALTPEERQKKEEDRIRNLQTQWEEIQFVR